MDISNLSDAEFKRLPITKMEELTGYFNSMKKTKAEMKVTLSEIKKNLQGPNSEVNEAKNQMNDLEHREEKIFNPNNKKKKERKKTRIG